VTTSVYLHLDVCPHCGRSDNTEGLHVGQSASGFHGYLAGDPVLPGWWRGPVATPADWLRFCNTAAEHGSIRWSDNNGNRLAQPDTIVDALDTVGLGEGMADWYRPRWWAEPPAIWFTEVDWRNLPTIDHSRADRLWWVADGYTFSTGDWS
jgi:hypothetical protein